MTTTTANQAQGYRPPKSPLSAGDVITVRSKIAVDASAMITAASDVLEMCYLPARCVPVDCVLVCDELDAGTALVMSVGIEDATGTTDDPDALIDATTIGQTGGVARMNAAAMLDIDPSDVDRKVSVTIDTPPGTDQDGDLMVLLTYTVVDRDD